MDFEEYPKVLHHPDHAPAVIERDPNPIRTGPHSTEPGGSLPFSGTPERFPPVTIPKGKNAKQEEEYYIAMGYRDLSDPKGFATSAAGRAAAGYHVYPRMLYHDTMQPIIVDSEEAEEGALAIGFRTSPEARAADLPAKTYLDQPKPASAPVAALLRADAPAPSGANSVRTMIALDDVQAMIDKAVAAALAPKKKAATVKKAVTHAKPRKVSAATRKKLSERAKQRHAKQLEGI